MRSSLVSLSARRPLLLLACWAVAAAASYLALRDLTFDLTGNSSLERSGPAWTRYQQSLDRFGGDEILVVSIRGTRPYDPDTLSEVRRLSRRFEALDGVRRVDSIATVAAISPRPDGGIDLSAALGEDTQAGDGGRVRRRLAADRIAPGSLVSGDEQSFAINVVLERGFEGFDALVASVAREVDRLDAAISGVPVFRVEINRSTQRELATLAPITALVLLAAFAWLLRSPFAAFLCLLPGACGVTAVLVAMSLRELPVTIFTLILPPVLFALGCAYATHLLSATGAGRRRLVAWRRQEAPLCLSGVTTAIGFGTLSLVRLDSIRWLGELGLVGVLVTLLASLTLLPALATRIPPKLSFGSRHVGWLEGAAAKLAEIAIRARGELLVAGLVLAILGAVGLTRLEIQTDLTRWLRSQHPARLDYLEIRDRLSGISPVNIVVLPEAGTDVLDDAVLRGIDGLSQFLESLPEVGKAVSIADPLRQIHGAFESDSDQPLPQGRALLEQYLLLLEPVPQLADLVTHSRDAANILLRVDDNASDSITGLDDAARGWWRRHADVPATVYATGIMYEYARAEDEIVSGQLRGLGFAFAAIALALVFALGSLRLAALSLVPNLAPLVVAFGALGWMQVPLEVGTALVGSMALGIAVDDTTHIIYAFARARRRGPADAALIRAYRTVVRPIGISTIALVSGFLVLVVSDFALTRNLGLLTAAVLVTCFVADLTLLGALLVGSRWDPARPEDSSTGTRRRWSWLRVRLCPLDTWEAERCQHPR